MQIILLFLLLLLGYTLIYTGLSKIWKDVTVAPNKSPAPGSG